MAYKFVLIGRFLKRKRLDAGLSQRDVGLKLGYGSAQFISNIERGEASLPPKKVKKLIPILNLSEQEVIKIMKKDYEMFLKSELKLK